MFDHQFPAKSVLTRQYHYVGLPNPIDIGMEAILIARHQSQVASSRVGAFQPDAFLLINRRPSSNHSPR